ncbi:MAG: DegV family protein [Oscillospiraceae bacterium]|nr:DegV family protein [Oscillospiraceae bacterium]
MKHFSLTCCSTADMPLEFFRDNDIPFACFHFIMDGKEYPDDLGQSMPFDVFYKKIADGATPTTSQVNAEDYEKMWTPLLETGSDILHITLSSGISGTINSAIVARETLLQSYPDRKIIIIDSLGASSGYGLLVTEALRLRDSGAALAEAQNWLEKNKLRLHHWFFSTDLSSYVRGGRISKAAAMFGTILKICPLLNMNTLGELIPREKIRTKRKVISEIVDRMERHAENGLDYSGKCYISNSACFDDARAVADLVEARFHHLDGKVMINSVGTVIGAHTGPGTVALFFFGDERVK